MENFAVKSESFALYEAFKKDVEKIGWKYNEKFGFFIGDDKTSFCQSRLVRSNCLYFSDKWNGKAAPLSFAFSNAGNAISFSLETQYGEALAFAKKVWEQENKIKFGFMGTCSLSGSHTLDVSAMWIPNNSSSYACPFADGFFTVTNSALSIPRFKVGDWVRDITNGRAYKVLSNDVLSGNMSCEVTKQGYIFQDLLEKWLPNRGEYCYCKLLNNNEWLFISSGEGFLLSHTFAYYANANFTDKYCRIAANHEAKVIRPATPEEIALLDTKLAEQGKRFDKEKCELVDIIKHKEPIIGEMAIFWDKNKCSACVRLFTHKKGVRCCDHIGCSWDNAILFESPEQYKAFLKS